MMLVLLTLFQFSVVLKDRSNAYDVNESYQEPTADGTKAWTVLSASPGEAAAAQREYLLFLGDPDSAMAAAAQQWCTYVKWNLAKCTSAEELTDLQQLPAMLLLESETYALGDALEVIRTLKAQGVIVVFGSLEDPQHVRDNPELKKFLGIFQVFTDQIKLSGIKLFEGLLLGGEAVYETKESELQRQDLQLEVPWYQVGSGTKVYMTGLLGQENLGMENERMPALIWRNGEDGGSVFVVVGDYLKDSTALGLLSGMAAEASSYFLYPVVNAQNISVAGFPSFAPENEAELKVRYGYSWSSLQQDVIWPLLLSVSERSGRKLTVFMQPQADYLDGTEPLAGRLRFYLKQMKEVRAEAGLSLQTKSMESLADKLERDAAFFEQEGSSYCYGAAFLDYEMLKEGFALPEQSLMDTVSTLVCDYTEEYPLLSYWNEKVTLQLGTNDGVNHTYRSDLRMRSIQSSLVYTNVILNLQPVFWPEEQQNQWEVMEKQFSGNLLTYWNKFRMFDSTTLSESNTRVRTLLNLDYAQERSGDTVCLQATLPGSQFVLRTHGEEIAECEGASWKQLEQDVYLLVLQDTSAQIQLQSASLYYYDQKS